jgi:hypothetical protein
MLWTTHRSKKTTNIVICIRFTSTMAMEQRGLKGINALLVVASCGVYDEREMPTLLRIKNVNVGFEAIAFGLNGCN